MLNGFEKKIPHMDVKEEDPHRTWFLSDTHFDHVNIIKYCNRPFDTIQEMNDALLRNWKETIAPEDLVFFLGDMAFGRGSREARWWLKQLTGRIVYIKGSHDSGIRPTSSSLRTLAVHHELMIDTSSIPLWLIHDPYGNFMRREEWCVHGHTHNLTPRMDPQRRRFNVGVDVCGFKPTSLATILNAISKEN